MTDRDKDRPDRTWEEEYNTEPQRISQRVSVAPTMAGGIALLIDGEHIDHFYENELEELEEATAAALDSIEQEGHCTASERKFERFLDETVRLQTELGWHLHILYAKAGSNDHNFHDYEELMNVVGSIEHRIDMLDAMASQLHNRDN